MAKKKVKEIEEQIIRTEFSDIMKKSFIDYSMSVIISRAIPDVRDGLKPVQRRTLYDMHELGIKHDSPYRKCARIVGDTMGKYHPHGDSSIYEALVVMAQDFKKGQTLVDGHGNFGSIEGDGAAAMRYTEARLERFTQTCFLADLDKDVVNFVPNFDETEKEPEVLPVRVPNILVNGSEGIAVGMTTSIPPHNLGEVIEAVKAYILNNDITDEELLRIMPGPDFPTGGIVTNKDELAEIYSTGTGRIKLRGKVEYEELKGGKQCLVITQIPYTMIGSGIGKFLNDVADLIESKKTTDISDISNQSSKEGIRIVIELKKGADVKNLENMLYKKTQLESTFGVNMLAIAGGRPETLSLKKIIEANVEFQFELCSRKYTNLLQKDMDKKEIQEGLIEACDVIDLIIEILRGSKDVKMAKACLTEGVTDGIKFKNPMSPEMARQLRFTPRQASAILEMRLQKLIGLEIKALKKEHEETLARIAKYEDLLNNYSSMSRQILEDLDSYKKEFAKPRLTVIENSEEAVFEENKFEESEIAFLMDRFGYARCVDVPTFERNKEAALAENAYVFTCMNTDKILVFTNTGNVHSIKARDLGVGKFRDKGVPIDNISNYDSANERVVCVTNLEKMAMKLLLFTTKQGMMKHVFGTEFDVAKRTVAATKLNDGDEVISVRVIENEHNVILRTHGGYFLRFAIDEVPEKKKTAVGVRGIKLSAGDYVEDVYFTTYTDDSVAVIDDKEVQLNKVKLLRRDSKGTKIRF